jgi:hypothetical protein
MTTINNQPISLFESYVADYKKDAVDNKISTPTTPADAPTEAEKFILTDSWINIDQTVQASMQNALATTTNTSTSEVWTEINDETGEEITFYDPEEEGTDEAQSTPSQAGITTQGNTSTLTDSWIKFDEKTGETLTFHDAVEIDIPYDKASAYRALEQAGFIRSKASTTAQAPVNTDSPATDGHLSSALSTARYYLSPMTNLAAGIAAMLPQIGQNNEAKHSDKHLAAVVEKFFKIGNALETLNLSVFNACGLNLMPMEAGRTDRIELPLGTRLSNYFSAFKGYVGAISNGTMGLTAGVAIAAAGVAATGLIGISAGVLAVGAGALVALYSLRSIPDAAVRQNVQNIVNNHNPGIQADLEELEQMLAEEIFRTERSRPIVAEMAVHHRNYCSTAQTIEAGHSELRHRQLAQDGVVEKTTSSQTIPAFDKPTNETTKGLVTQFIDQLSAEAKKFADKFIDHHKKDRAAEAKFNKDHNNKLINLTVLFDQDSITSDTCEAVRKDINADRKSSNTVSDKDLRTNILRGAALTQAIRSSDVNFGAVEHTATAITLTRGNGIPSSLTTVRYIAQYIDAAERSRTINNDISVQKMDDGSYLIADTDRKLYNFIAGASSAHIKLIEPSVANGPQAGETRFAMAISDYSSNFPGGTNHMEFETQRDENGNVSLALRFSKEENLQEVANHPLNTPQTQRQALLNLSRTDTDASRVDFSGMSDTEIRSQLDSLQSVLSNQLAMLKETQRQQTLLNGWKNPSFTSRT